MLTQNIIDFVENPSYNVVAVAIGKEELVILKIEGKKADIDVNSAIALQKAFLLIAKELDKCDPSNLRGLIASLPNLLRSATTSSNTST